MPGLMYDLIKMRRISTGRRLFALRQVRGIAGNQGRNDLLAAVDEALQFDTNTYEMELAWKRARELPKSRGDAFDFDNQIDRTLSAIYRRLEDNVTLMAGTDLAEPSQALLTQLFPAGVRPIIQQKFEEQLVNNRAILAGLKENDAVVDTVGLRSHITRLEQLARQFDAELQETKKPEVSWGKLCSLRTLGNMHLRRIVAKVIGIGGFSESDEKVREELLAPILFQAEQAMKTRKSRSDSADVEPDVE